MDSTNSFVCSGSTSTDVDEVVAALLQDVQSRRTSDVPPDLGVLFVSPDFQDDIEHLSQRLCEALGIKRLMGCMGESIIHGAEEIESEPCVSLWLAWMPTAKIDLVQLDYERSPDGGSFVGWPDALESANLSGATLLTLAEPFSFPADVFLERINEDRPGVSVIGGMASGGTTPGESRLLLQNEVLTEGAVVAVLRDANVSPVVSQGCRPVGAPFIITQAERNVILELGGKPAHEQLKDIYDRLPNCDKDLMRQGIHVGRVVNEYQETFEYGDFLIRQVTGMNQDDGSILVSDYFRIGQTVQFHVRDSTTASEDLSQLLENGDRPPVLGSLLFTCNGRGMRMFEDPHHDAAMVNSKVGPVANAGFFCQGEMGPVGGRNFLHGFTASIALFH